MISFWIGYDPRELDAWVVAHHTLNKSTNRPYPVRALSLRLAEYHGYDREMIVNNNKRFDVISDAPMSTEFAISRFMTPLIAKKGWAIFCDCDFLFRKNISELEQYLDKQYAVMCVKHDYTPKNKTKMDNQIQTVYPRKNWSSFMAFNCEHPANERLTLNLINTAKGCELHQFCWLKDEEIGALPQEFNYLEGEGQDCKSPIAVHFTNRLPSQIGDCEYSAEWYSALNDWIECQR